MSSTNDELVVVLDACVLVPISFCDIFLRQAEGPPGERLYLPRWSQEILAELSRTLRDRLSMPPEKIAYRIGRMKETFPEAMVCGYEPLVAAMPIQERDRHVLAAAVHARADAIVTANVRHFPAAVLEPFGIESLTPDEFLVRQCSLEPEIVNRKFREQAAGIRKTVRELKETLRQHAPRFCAALGDESDATLLARFVVAVCASGALAWAAGVAQFQC